MSAPAARCLVVQHAEPEGPGAVGRALDAAGVVLDVRRVHAGDEVPVTVADVDGVVVMGGPVSAHLDNGFPTRRAELDLLRAALGEGVPTLGVCLGAQLLALAAGGDVFPGEAGPEIGWGPVHLADTARADPLFHGLPAELTVLHWHGDTFELPGDAMLLASNETYRAQAFRAGAAAWGIQFHVEVDEDHVAGFVAAFGADAARAPGGAAGIAGGAAVAVRALHPVAELLCGRFAELVAGHAAASG